MRSHELVGWRRLAWSGHPKAEHPADHDHDYKEGYKQYCSTHDEERFLRDWHIQNEWVERRRGRRRRGRRCGWLMMPAEHDMQRTTRVSDAVLDQLCGVVCVRAATEVAVGLECDKPVALRVLNAVILAGRDVDEAVVRLGVSVGVDEEVGARERVVAFILDPIHALNPRNECRRDDPPHNHVRGQSRCSRREERPSRYAPSF
mmetsp:Transcript_24777/g.52662  ORF Transcript_24777/g.52662 Transcript_24777/m.52662 type:complete len:203 (+) Transcript_24777:174-782(+)